ncbi:MAG: HNH endonuclease, partial [Verrucomicrobia bacterium]
ASHAKPWSECATDADRLNVFNGLLLCAHLDALFDRGLMTFSAEGNTVFSNRIDLDSRRRLGLFEEFKLRWIAEEHLPFLEWHRRHVFVGE